MKNWQQMLCESEPGANRVTRRAALQTGAGVAVATELAAWMGRSALAQVSVAPDKENNETGRDVFVNIFLRGAADGLSLVVPYAEDDYYKARPTLAIAAPKRGNAGAALRLDDRFGLHPALSPLLPLWVDGSLAVLHAVGSGDQTRSHFEAMATMERGEYIKGGSEARGWLARHLSAVHGSASPLRAVAFGAVMPDTLRGATSATAVESLSDLKINAPRPELATALTTLYAPGTDAASVAGRETIAALKTLQKIDPAHYKPAHGATYPQSPLGEGLKQTACLIKAGVGLEAAFLDREGWDTHVTQGGATGWLALQLDDVAKSLAAFAQDLGKERDRVTLVVQTEFGRRVAENSSLGTDHGRASAMFVWGGAVNGGKIHGGWPGLRPEQLESPGDLRVVNDYRLVLAEILAKRCGNAAGLETVFPGAGITAERFLGVVRS
ncbi:MAG: DUF1501 domain-containing protein [Armatimonadetes bacterium]|nr:DUF1501 domain-containing protein [Armatimonadota bacterium]